MTTFTTTTKMGSSMKKTIKEELRNTATEMKLSVKDVIIFIISFTLFVAGFNWLLNHNGFMPKLDGETTNVTITMMETMAVNSTEDLELSQTFGGFTIIEDGTVAKYSFFLNQEQLDEYASQPTKGESGYTDVNLLRRVNWLTPGNLDHLIIEIAENDQFFGAIFTVTWPITCPKITQNALQLVCGDWRWSFDAAAHIFTVISVVIYTLIYLAVCITVILLSEKLCKKCHKNEEGE